MFPGIVQGPLVRVYVDTSVFGGAFDFEFQRWSREFFRQVFVGGRFKVVTSPIVQDEIEPAPPRVRDLFREVLKIAEIHPFGGNAIRLQEAYLSSGIVGPRSRTDALHVATATVSKCAAIVSWNFEHIVHFEKIPLYNEVNLAMGYEAIGIHTPQEVLHYDHEDV